MTYLNDLITYMVVVMIAVSALLLLALYRLDWSWDGFKEHWATSGAGRGIVKFVVGLALLALLASYANSAFAGEWFRYTEVYAGVERTYYRSPQCVLGKTDHYLTSNGGVRQHIYSFSNNLTLLGNYTHHSCVINGDRAPYDAVGVQLNWRFERK